MPYLSLTEAMRLRSLVDRLEELHRNARPVPLTDQVRLDPAGVYGVVSEMRGILDELDRREVRLDPTQAYAIVDELRAALDRIDDLRTSS
jgi:hypothetical protein